MKNILIRSLREMVVVILFLILSILAITDTDIGIGITITYKLILESRFGLKIEGENNLLNGKDARSYLNAYEKAMSRFSTDFIKELATLFKREGVVPYIKFSRFTEESDYYGCYGMVDDYAVIELFVESPYTGEPTLGVSPGVIAHEVGHMLHNGILMKDGKNKFNRNWDVLNEGYPYGQWKDGYEYVYVSEYASSDRYEDFAETIEDILTNSEWVHIKTSDPDWYVLKAKVDFIEKIVKKYFSNFKGYSTWGYKKIPEKTVSRQGTSLLH